MVKNWDQGKCPECDNKTHSCYCPDSFDEDKVMLGFENKEKAIGAYLRQYDSGLFLGPVVDMKVEDLKNLIKDSGRKKIDIGE